LKPPAIPLEFITALEPVCLRTTVPEAYLDSNGHMNVRWYLALFDDASDTLHEWMGLTPEFHAAHHTGTMDLEHHIRYLNEVMPGSKVTIYVRFVNLTPKRLHYLMFLVDDTRGRLAATLECINTFVDLERRKTAPFPPEAAAKIVASMTLHSNLAWETPVSGTMRA
jgi:acyl-CoA thioester hydrolase